MLKMFVVVSKETSDQKIKELGTILTQLVTAKYPEEGAAILKKAQITRYSNPVKQGSEYRVNPIQLHVSAKVCPIKWNKEGIIIFPKVNLKFFGLENNPSLTWAYPISSVLIPFSSFSPSELKGLKPENFEYILKVHKQMREEGDDVKMAPQPLELTLANSAFIGVYELVKKGTNSFYRMNQVWISNPCLKKQSVYADLESQQALSEWSFNS